MFLGVRMRACGDVPDGMRHILRLYRSVEQFCPVCAFRLQLARCGGGRASEMRGTDPDITQVQ